MHNFFPCFVIFACILSLSRWHCNGWLDDWYLFISRYNHLIDAYVINTSCDSLSLFSNFSIFLDGNTRSDLFGKSLQEVDGVLQVTSNPPGFLIITDSIDLLVLKWYIFSKARGILNEQTELFSIGLVWQRCMATLKILIGQKYAASSRFFLFRPNHYACTINEWWWRWLTLSFATHHSL